ncbi:hypothetical protein ACFCV3_41645 [Kribbella sp. NPDC056345]|uniref:hypothetical protein n=1 Tax=Kribbella sp. NPDC056345 TaxID=3345789 RepID=UPI0035D8F8E0
MRPANSWDEHSWILLPEAEELVPAFRAAEELLLDLAVSEEESATEQEPWRLPKPIAGREALNAFYRVWEVLRGAMDELAWPPVEPDQSVRPRLYSDGKERVPFRAVQIDAADRLLLMDAVAKIELATTSTERAKVADPDELRRLRDLAELLDLICDGQETVDLQSKLVRPLLLLTLLLNQVPDDDTRLMVDVILVAGDTVELSPTQSEAYGRVATRVNTIITGGDPIARWVY